MAAAWIDAADAVAAAIISTAPLAVGIAPVRAQRPDSAGGLADGPDCGNDTTDGYECGFYGRYLPEVTTGARARRMRTLAQLLSAKKHADNGIKGTIKGTT
jgi:hypothetical protein